MVVHAHATLLQVKPWCTSGFSATYPPSSKLTNSWCSVCKYGKIANKTRATPIHRATRLLMFVGRLMMVDGAPWRRRSILFLDGIANFFRIRSIKTCCARSKIGVWLC